MAKASDTGPHVILIRGDYDRPLRNKKGEVRVFPDYATANAARRSAGDVAAPVAREMAQRWGWRLDKEV